ncbi:MAG TPA: hypothetical protein VJY33_10300, partial [Isosphaeraceae bacterium]|nr:hypothetical protein [Isosphaeraceae bacterium]
DYTALEGLKSVVAESKLQELRNEVWNRAFAIWLGRVQGGKGATLGMHRPIKRYGGMCRKGHPKTTDPGRPHSMRAGY